MTGYAQRMVDSAMSKQGFEDEEAVDITKDRWMQAQRDLITTSLDYNLQAIADLIAAKRIDLSPTFQRRDRWDLRRRSMLIESFLMNVPLPPVFLNEDEYGQYSIIDGKQRLTTVSDFMTNKFKLDGLGIFTEANGLYFSELDPALQSVLETRASLRAIILLRMSDPLIKYHVFQRLNTGGVRLNAQEVRNVTFAGDLNNLIVSASGYEPFARLLGITPSNRTKSALWQQMRDVELVLRYLALRDTWEKYSGSLGGAMNTFMGSEWQMPEGRAAALIEDFKLSVDKIEAIFGNTAFRRWDGGTLKPRKPVLATLFDAQMIAVHPHSLKRLESVKGDIQDRMRRLFDDEDFTRSIGSQTNTPRSVRTRIQMVKGVVDSALGG